MTTTRYVLFAALISLAPTLCQAQGQTPAPAPAAKAVTAQPAAAQPAAAVPQQQPTAVAGNGPLAKALVEFTTCHMTAVDRVAATIADLNLKGWGVKPNPFQAPVINRPYTDFIKFNDTAYKGADGKSAGWASNFMKEGMSGSYGWNYLWTGMMQYAFVGAAIGHGAAMVIAEQNRCVKVLNDQLKY